jgi:alpha-L-rhamnosidase
VCIGGTAYLRVLEALYDHTGDVSVVSKYFEGVRRWVERVRMEYNKTKLANLYYYYGDWVPPPGYAATNGSLVSSYAFLNDVRSLIRFAQLLNLTSWQQQYTLLYDALTTEFHTTFWSSDHKCYADCAQTANALALASPGVVPDSLRATALKSLVSDLQARGHITVGIIGLSQVFPVLSANGYHDLALQLATSVTYPSFGWQWTNEYDNATTLWELWDSCMEGSEMNSKNHVMFSSIGSWLYRDVAGIHLDGLDNHVTIRPRQGYPRALLPHIAVRVMTVKGLVSVELNRTEELRTTLQVHVPANLHAHVVLEPAVKGAVPVSVAHGGQRVWSREGGAELTGENGPTDRGVLSVGVEDGGSIGQVVVVRVESGVFVFDAEWQLAEAEAA